MTKWVRVHWPDERVTFAWEISDGGWVTRGVELDGPELRPRAAAALEEVIWAQDQRGIAGVRAYESRYGVLAEKPIEDWDFPHEAMSRTEFERIWTEARLALESGP